MLPELPRGDSRGWFQRSALKPLSRGEPRQRCVPALFAGAQRASGVGGTRPPRLSPGGGNGKVGVQTSLLPQALAGSSSASPLGGLWSNLRTSDYTVASACPNRLGLRSLA